MGRNRTRHIRRKGAYDGIYVIYFYQEMGWLYQILFYHTPQGGRGPNEASIMLSQGFTLQDPEGKGSPKPK